MQWDYTPAAGDDEERNTAITLNIIIITILITITTQDRLLFTLRGCNLSGRSVESASVSPVHFVVPGGKDYFYCCYYYHYHYYYC